MVTDCDTSPLEGWLPRGAEPLGVALENSFVGHPNDSTCEHEESEHQLRNLKNQPLSFSSKFLAFLHPKVEDPRDKPAKNN